jgi:hypothetical protein
MLHPEMLVRGGPHPFGRLPLAMASQGGWTPVNLGGQMHPMSLFMEVRSNNNQQEDQQASRGQSPTSLGEFDDFLPCHSRHVARSSSSRPDTERARPRPVVVTSTSAAQAFPGLNQTRPPGPGNQPTAVPASVDEFMNEMFRQVIAALKIARGKH